MHFSSSPTKCFCCSRSSWFGRIKTLPHYFLPPFFLTSFPFLTLDHNSQCIPICPPCFSRSASFGFWMRRPLEASFCREETDENFVKHCGRDRFFKPQHTTSLYLVIGEHPQTQRESVVCLGIRVTYILLLSCPHKRGGVLEGRASRLVSFNGYTLRVNCLPFRCFGGCI